MDLCIRIFSLLVVGMTTPYLHCLHRRAHSRVSLFRRPDFEIPLDGTRNATRMHGWGSGKQRKI